MNAPNKPTLGMFFGDAATIAMSSAASKDDYFGDKPTKAVSPEEMDNRIAARRAKAFATRTPRDILKKSVPQPFDLSEAPLPIAQFAYAFSDATGFDHSGMMVAATTAAASIIDDRYQLEVSRGSNWVVSARQWAFLCAPPSGGKSPTLIHMHEQDVKAHAFNGGDAGAARKEAFEAQLNASNIHRK